MSIDPKPAQPLSANGVSPGETVTPGQDISTAAPPPDDSPASPVWKPPAVKIAGYQVLREMGRGGQAVVCEAIQLSTKRKVAIKIMREGPLASAREQARFDREVQVLAALNHPNIVRVVDRGTTADASFFLAMDYVGGPPLDEWLAAYYRAHPEGPPPSDPSELLRMFLKICDAIAAAHLRGIVHRDLKPGNIRMDDNGEPIVLDFGLARTALPGMTDELVPQPVSITGQFLGSLPWASPEQAEGIPEKIDVRSDVYSLGVMLYQMLTGRFPYEVVGTMRDVLNAIITVQPLAPSKIIAAKDAREAKRRLRLTKGSSRPLNSVIDAIVLKALAKRREDRYQSASELSQDLGNYLSGRPTVAGGKPQHSAWHPAMPAFLGAVIGSSTAGLVAVVIVVGCLIFAWTRLHGGAKPDDARSTPDPIHTSSPISDPVDHQPMTDPPSHMDAQGHRVVDLMPLVEFDRPFRGVWERDAQSLSTTARRETGGSLMRILYEPPAEYDFRVEFTRNAGTGDVQQIIARNGVRFDFGIDMGEQSEKIAGIRHVGGSDRDWRVDGPWVVKRAGPIENNRIHVAIVSVRETSIAATLDGKGVVSFPTDFSNLTPEPDWDAYIPVLGVGTWDSSVAFHSITVTEISGRGKNYVPNWWVPAHPKPVSSVLPPFPTFDGPVGLPTSETALVAHPAIIKGLNSWTIESRAHRGKVNVAAYSPDGKYLATGGEDGSVRLWNSQSRHLDHVFLGHMTGVDHFAWSPDSKSLASSGERDTRIWEVPSGRLIARLTEVWGALEWSRDGHRLAVFAAVVDTSTWKLIGVYPKLPDEDVRCVTWLDDNVRIAFGTGHGGVFICNTTNGTVTPIATSREHGINAIAVSPDGKRLVWSEGGAGGSGKVTVWDFGAAAIVKTLDNLDREPKVCWSSGGTIVTANGDHGHVVEWNVDSGVIRESASHGQRSITYSPNFRFVALVDLLGQVSLIDADRWQPIGPLCEEWNGTGTPVWTPDASQVAIETYAKPDEKKVRFLSASGDFTKEFALTDRWDLGALEFSSDGNRLASSDANGHGRILLFDVGLEHPLIPLGDDNTHASRMAWRPNSPVLATASNDEITLWDTKTSKAIKTVKIADPCRTLAWSSDGKILAAGLEKGTTEIRNADGDLARVLHEPHRLDVINLFWSADSAALVTGGDGWTIICDMRGSGSVSGFEPQYVGIVFSRDGNLVAGFKTGTQDSVVSDSRYRRAVQSFKNTSDTPWALSWHGDDTIAVGSSRGTIQYFSVKTGESLGVMLTALPGKRVALIGREGRVHCTGGAEKSLVYITQTDAGQETLTPEEFRAKYGWKD